MFREHGFTTLGRGLGVLFADVTTTAGRTFTLPTTWSFNFLYLNRGNGKLEELGDWLASGKRSRAAGWEHGSGCGDYRRNWSRVALGYELSGPVARVCTRTSARDLSTTNRMRRESPRWVSPSLDSERL